MGSENSQPCYWPVQTQVTDYVFIGAGGAAIPLLQKQVFLKANT